jgi:serine protease
MYHNVLTTSSGLLAYINIPYQSDAGADCGANAVNQGSAGVLDGVSIIGGAVVAGTQADPFGTAWINLDGVEVGSDCNFLNLRDITFSTGTFAIQGLWSNKRSVCSDSGP